MKTLNFNKKSIHYRLANITGEFDVDEEHDICSYSRHVMAGFAASMLVLALGIFAWYLLVSTVLGIIFSLIYGTMLFDLAGAVGLGLITGCLVLLLMAFGKSRFMDYKRAKAKMNRELGIPLKPDSFLANAYKGWKEKYCVRVTFEQ